MLRVVKGVCLTCIWKVFMGCWDLLILLKTSTTMTATKTNTTPLQRKLRRRRAAMRGWIALRRDVKYRRHMRQFRTRPRTVTPARDGRPYLERIISRGDRFVTNVMNGTRRIVTEANRIPWGTILKITSNCKAIAFLLKNTVELVCS